MTNGKDINKWSITACKIHKTPSIKKIIIGEIAIIKIIESACGITSINQSMNWKNV